MVATESLLDGNQLSLTQLGRNITGSEAAKHLGWQKDFQANSIKHRTVLSVARQGKEVRRRQEFAPIPLKKLSIIYWALNEYIKLVHTAGRPKL
jgi:hypothetical protein